MNEPSRTDGVVTAAGDRPVGEQPGPGQVAGPEPTRARRSGHRREVVSYVRRTTRLTETQQHAWDRYAEGLVLDFDEGPRETAVDPAARPLDLVAAFGRRAPLLVEIGSGGGEALVASAEAHPDWDLLAFEVYQPAVASTLSRVRRAGVENVRVVMADAVGGLERLLAPASVTELHLFFPDPWHKRKHHKRRLVNPGFAALAASRLVPGGRWRMATDWADYAEQMREVCRGRPDLVDEHEGSEDGWAPRHPNRPRTKFEGKGLDRERLIRDLVFRRPA